VKGFAFTYGPQRTAYGKQLKSVLTLKWGMDDRL
jgi:hypothetical protein